MTETKPVEILLAEDNPADVALVRRALKEHRVDCVLNVVRDGAAAIQWIQTRDTDSRLLPLDLLLVDMHLPKRDGEDILKHLRATENYGQTPVIAMSSLDSSINEEKTVGHDALVYFKKPSTLDEFMQLGAIVRGVLARKREESETATKNTGGGA